MDFTSLDGVVIILLMLLNAAQKAFGVMNTGEVGGGSPTLFVYNRPISSVTIQNPQSKVHS